MLTPIRSHIIDYRGLGVRFKTVTYYGLEKEKKKKKINEVRMTNRKKKTNKEQERRIQILCCVNILTWYLWFLVTGEFSLIPFS